MSDDEVTQDILPCCGHQKRAKSEFSCQPSCGDNDFSNSNPNKAVIV